MNTDYIQEHKEGRVATAIEEQTSVNKPVVQALLIVAAVTIVSIAAILLFESRRKKSFSERLGEKITGEANDPPPPPF